MAKETKYFNLLGGSVRDMTGSTATVNEIKILVETDPSLQLHGNSEISRKLFIDHEEIYNRIFGSGLFEEYIGHLAAETLFPFKPFTKVEKLDRVKFQEKLQEEREKKLAGILKDRLNLYVQGNKEEFIRCAEAQVSMLSNVAYGVEMLNTIGNIYAREAALKLGKKVPLPLVAEWLKNAGFTGSSGFIDLTRHCCIWLLLKNMRERLRKYTDEELEEYIRSRKELFVDYIWKNGVIDIERTLYFVCQMVLQDKNANEEELRLLAEGLKILGEIFQEALCEWECSTSSMGVAGGTKKITKLD